MAFSYRTLRSFIKDYAPWPRRRFRAFGIGAMKTGTTTIADMLDDRYRVRHEAETNATVRLVLAWESGAISRDALLRRLRWRDRRLRLDLESSHLLGHFAAELAELFPDAKYLVTVREPWSWLVSRISFHDKHTTRPWRLYRQRFMVATDSDFLPAEEGLRRRGLCPLRTYLSQYEGHYGRIRSHLPADRCLVVRTERIDESIGVIAGFLDVPDGALTPRRSNPMPKRSGVLDELDPDFVAASIWKWCPEVVTRYFPERAERYARARHPALDSG